MRVLMPSYMPCSQKWERRNGERRRRSDREKRSWNKRYRISRKNTIAMAKPGIMTLLNLTVVHYGLAFLNDWLLSFTVFFSPFLFSLPLQDIHLWTHRDIKIMFLRGDQQLTLGFFFSLPPPCFSSNRNCTPLIVYKNVLWTRWGTLTWFLPTTDAPALFLCLCSEHTLFIRLFHVHDTSTVAHQNPAPLPSPKATPRLE